MKPIIASLSIVLAMAAAPALALTIDVNTVAPDLTFPTQVNETVTQDVTGIDK